jgi:hypothetical protein
MPSHPPSVGLTLLTRRVINGCFAREGQDEAVASSVIFQVAPSAKPDAAKLNTP